MATATAKPATDTLPDKPSALIRVALADQEAVERLPKYVVDMGAWHSPGAYDKCHVCFAGGVMAMSLGMPFGAETYPDDFPEDTRWKLNALDSFRHGCVHGGLGDLYLMRPEHLAAHVDVTPYSSDPAAFKADMSQRELRRQIMPFDGDVSKYTTKPEADVFSVEDFRDWLRTMPPNGRYSHENPRVCALAQYTIARGGRLLRCSYVIGGKRIGVVGSRLGGIAYYGLSSEMTFGAALARANAALAEHNR